MESKRLSTEKLERYLSNGTDPNNQFAPNLAREVLELRAENARMKPLLKLVRRAGWKDEEWEYWVKERDDIISSKEPSMSSKPDINIGAISPRDLETAVLAIQDSINNTTHDRSDIREILLKLPQRKRPVQVEIPPGTDTNDFRK